MIIHEGRIFGLLGHVYHCSSTTLVSLPQPNYTRLRSPSIRPYLYVHSDSMGVPRSISKSEKAKACTSAPIH